MKVRAYRDGDWPEWLRMSVALFPEYSAENLAAGMRDFRAREDAEVCVVRDTLRLGGIAEQAREMATQRTHGRAV